METHIIGLNKRNTIFLFIFFIIGVGKMFSFGRGIFYPRLVFGFDNIDEHKCPLAADKACDEANSMTSEINAIFHQPGNSFKCEFEPIFITTKPYSHIYIRQIVYIYESCEYEVLSEAGFNLSMKVRAPGENKDGWVTTNNKYFWISGWNAKMENPSDESKKWPETNFEKIFKGKKVGDEFTMDVRIIYHFDDEPEKTLTIPFRVGTFKGKWVSPFAGL